MRLGIYDVIDLKGKASAPPSKEYGGKEKRGLDLEKDSD